MSNPTELPDLDRLEALARAATPGPWEVETVHSEGEYGTDEDGGHGFDAYAVVDSKGRPMFDSLNRDDSSIHTDTDGDVFYAWDDLAKRDATFIAAANPAAVLELIALARRAKPEGEAPQAEVVYQARKPNEKDWKEISFDVFQFVDPHNRRKLYTAPAAQQEESGAQATPALTETQRMEAAERYGTGVLPWSCRIHPNQPLHIIADAMEAELNDLRPLVKAARAAQPQGAQADELTDDDKRLVARGMERWRKGIAGECRLPPAGWHCTRTPGHEGPCAAHPAQQATAPGALDADEMTRLRRLMRALGHVDAFEQTDEYVRGVLCTVLGQAAGKLEAAPSAPGTPEAPRRNDVLEEAAQVCEAWGNAKVMKWAGDPEMLEDAKARAWDGLQCAAAIRELKQRAAQLDGGQGEGKAHG